MKIYEEKKKQNSGLKPNRVVTFGSGRMKSISCFAEDGGWADLFTHVLDVG